MKQILAPLKLSLLPIALIFLSGCESTSTKSTDTTPTNVMGDTAAQAEDSNRSSDILIPAVVVEAPEPVEPVVEAPEPVIEAPQPVEPVVEAPKTQGVERVSLKLTEHAQERLDEMDTVCELSNEQYNALAELYLQRTNELRQVVGREARLVINQKYYQLLMSELTAQQAKDFRSYKNRQ